jgi:Transposase, Mutator family/Acyl-CoA dehydrogenase, C-terminal domain
MADTGSLGVRAELSKVLESEHADLLREGVALILAEVMEMEVARLAGGERYERTDERAAYRNGYRPRRLDTRVGTLELEIPRLRSGPSYLPSFLEARKRSEQALLSVVMQAYVEGVSTRKVERLVEQLGVEGISKSTVSRICKGLDERAVAFRGRPLEGAYPYVWLDARASGSQSVSFEDVRLPPEALRGGFPAGRLTGDWMDRNLNAGAFHATASVGIAEAAHDGVLAALASRGGAEGSPRAQTLAAENAIELSAIRAVFGRAGALLDEHDVRSAAAPVADEEMADLFAEVQSAKTFVNEAAVRVVDRALALAGGAGYMSRHPLSRAYRDVRAGASCSP